MKPILAMLLLVTCTFASAPAEEAGSHHPTGLPGGASVILENGSVQVLRVHIAPREKTTMHDVTARVVVWLADAHFIDSFPDGTTHEETRKAGPRLISPSPPALERADGRIRRL